MASDSPPRNGHLLFACFLVLSAITVTLLVMSVVCLLGYLGFVSRWRIPDERSLLLALLWAVYGFGIWCLLLLPVWARVKAIKKH